MAAASITLASWKWERRSSPADGNGDDVHGAEDNGTWPGELPKPARGRSQEQTSLFLLDPWANRSHPTPWLTYMDATRGSSVSSSQSSTLWRTYRDATRGSSISPSPPQQHDIENIERICLRIPSIQTKRGTVERPYLPESAEALGRRLHSEALWRTWRLWYSHHTRGRPPPPRGSPLRGRLNPIWRSRGA